MNDPICYLADTLRWPNVGLMLGQRRRRWAHINPALGQRNVYVGQCNSIHVRLTYVGPERRL